MRYLILIALILSGCGTSSLTKEADRTEQRNIIRNVDRDIVENQRTTFEIPRSVFLEFLGLEPLKNFKPDTTEEETKEEPVRVIVDRETTTTEKETESKEEVVRDIETHDESKDNRTPFQLSSFWVAVVLTLIVIILILLKVLL